MSGAEKATTTEPAASTERTFDVGELTELGTRILVAHGLPDDDAHLVADSLVTADLWGHPSHGMLRLGWYVARIRHGVMNAVTDARVVVDNGAVAVLDGGDGVGQVVTARACEEAVHRAHEHGVGVVAVRRSNHFGTAAYWTRRMADAGCIGILTTNGSPAMAPWGGQRKTVGANPWSIAVPGGRHGMPVLDIANTEVARGKIYAALQRGEEIPPTWATDRTGLATTDPLAAIDGTLLPMGAHKGYAISFMMDVLSGVLTGAEVADGVVGPYVPDQPSGCGHLVLALRVSAVQDPAVFTDRLDRLIDTTTSGPLAPGAARIYYPGQRENEAAQSTTVTLPHRTVTELADLAASCGVATGILEAAT